MTDYECIHGLEHAWCATCKHGPERPDPVMVEATFRARYDGECRGCNLPFGVGALVHRLSNGSYVHKGCE